MYTPSPPVCIIFGPLLTYQLSFTCFAQSQPAFHFRLESVGFVACPSVAVTGEPYRPPRSKKKRETETANFIQWGLAGQEGLKIDSFCSSSSTWTHGNQNSSCSAQRVKCTEAASWARAIDRRDRLANALWVWSTRALWLSVRIETSFAFCTCLLGPGGQVVPWDSVALFCLLACLRSLMVDDRTAGRKVKILKGLCLTGKIFFKMLLFKRYQDQIWLKFKVKTFDQHLNPKDPNTPHKTKSTPNPSLTITAQKQHWSSNQIYLPFGGFNRCNQFESDFCSPLNPRPSIGTSYSVPSDEGGIPSVFQTRWMINYDLQIP